MSAVFSPKVIFPFPRRIMVIVEWETPVYSAVSLALKFYHWSTLRTRKAAKAAGEIVTAKGHFITGRPKCVIMIR